MFSRSVAIIIIQKWSSNGSFIAEENYRAVTFEIRRLGPRHKEDSNRYRTINLDCNSIDTPCSARNFGRADVRFFIPFIFIGVIDCSPEVARSFFSSPAPGNRAVVSFEKPKYYVWSVVIGTRTSVTFLVDIFDRWREPNRAFHP